MRTRALLTASVLVLAGCGARGGPDAEWSQVSEHTTCEALAPSHCVGAYGFTVRSDGHYTVGPAPGGVALEGALTDAQRSQLSTDAAGVAAAASGSPQCVPINTLAGVTDRVDLVDPRGAGMRVYDLGGTPGSACYVGPLEGVDRLHGDLATLMARYYPRPFPPS